MVRTPPVRELGAHVVDDGEEPEQARDHGEKHPQPDSRRGDIDGALLLDNPLLEPGLRLESLQQEKPYEDGTPEQCEQE